MRFLKSRQKTHILLQYAQGVSGMTLGFLVLLAYHMRFSEDSHPLLLFGNSILYDWRHYKNKVSRDYNSKYPEERNTVQHKLLCPEE